MRFGKHTNGTSCEYEMQEYLQKWLKKKGFRFIPELLVSEVHRRPDFLVLKNGNGLINIEAKCNDWKCLLSQLKDNSIYCDYSFAFIPDYCLTPKWFKRALLETNFGLLIYNYEKHIITEVLEAHLNKGESWNKELNQKIKKYVDINSKVVRTKVKKFW